MYLGQDFLEAVTKARKIAEEANEWRYVYYLFLSRKWWMSNNPPVAKGRYLAISPEGIVHTKEGEA